MRALISLSFSLFVLLGVSCLCFMSILCSFFWDFFLLAADYIPTWNSYEKSVRLRCDLLSYVDR